MENSNDRNQAIASSLATVLQKNFNVKGPQATSQIERCPTFVAKEKSIKPKFLSKNKKVGFSFSSSSFFLHFHINPSIDVDVADSSAFVFHPTATDCQGPSLCGPPVFQRDTLQSLWQRLVGHQSPGIPMHK